MKASLSFAILIVIIITIIVVPTILLAHGQEEEDFPTLQILNGVDGVQEIPLKAIQTNGNIESQEDYSIDPSNVITVEKDKNIVLMNDQGIISKVNAIDSKLESADLYFADNLVKADLPSGSYILSVIIQTDDGVEYGFVTIMVVLAPTQTLSEINIQNIINAFTSKNIETNIIFEDGDDDNEPPEEEPSICYFDQTQPECQPDEEGNCPNNWPKNDNDQCHPGGACPEGYGRVDDDETGTCYPEEDITTCEGSNAKVLDPDDCSIYEPDFPPAPEVSAADNDTSSTSSSPTEEDSGDDSDNDNNDDDNDGSNNDSNDSNNDSEEDNNDDDNEDEDDSDEDDEDEDEE